MNKFTALALLATLLYLFCTHASTNAICITGFLMLANLILSPLNK